MAGVLLLRTSPKQETTYPKSWKKPLPGTSLLIVFLNEIKFASFFGEQSLKKQEKSLTSDGTETKNVDTKVKFLNKAFLSKKELFAGVC